MTCFMFRQLTCIFKSFLILIVIYWLYSMLLTLLTPPYRGLVFVALHLFCVPACFLKPAPLFLLPAFQSELRHGPFYYMKQPALTTDPVDVVPQDGRNDFYCWLCHREGQVLCCELCPRVYHAKCLKLPAEPEGDWFCPECEVSRWRRVCVCGCTQVIVGLKANLACLVDERGVILCAMSSQWGRTNRWNHLLSSVVHPQTLSPHDTWCDTPAS